MQDGTTGPEGPVSIDEKRHRLVKKLLAEGEDAVLAFRDELGSKEAGAEGDMDEEGLAEAVGLVLAGCEPGERYYKLVLDPGMTLESFLRDPDSAVLFSKKRSELDKAWTASLLMAAEGSLTPWEEMAEHDLEDWAERLGLDVPDDDEEGDDSEEE